MSLLCLELINLGKLVERGVASAPASTPDPIPCAELGEGSSQATPEGNDGLTLFPDAPEQSIPVSEGK